MIINDIDKQVIESIRKDFSLRQNVAENIIKSIKKEYSRLYFHPEKTIETKDNYLTGILALDIHGGFPYGITQICGQPGSYKSTLAIDIIGRHCEGLYINADAKPEDFPDNLSGNEKFIIMDNIHGSSKALKDMAKVGILPDLIVIDSIAAMDRSVDTLKTLKKLSAARPELKIIITNQMRNYGLSGGDDPFGAQPIHSLSSEILRVRKIDRKASGTNVIYENITRRKKIVISYNQQGKVSNNLTIINILTEHGIIKRIGTAYAYKNKRYRISDLIMPAEDNKLLEILSEINQKSLGIPDHVRLETYVERKRSFTTIR